MDIVPILDERYRGTLNVWQRLTLDEADPNAPVRHVHGCPTCYEQVPCEFPCSLEPDLECDDGTPSGGYLECDACNGSGGVNTIPEEPKKPWELDTSEPLLDWARQQQT